MLYNDSIYDNLQREYNKLGGNIRNYKISPKISNTIKWQLKKVRENVRIEEYITEITNCFAMYLKLYLQMYYPFDPFMRNELFHPMQTKYRNDFMNIANEKIAGVEKAHEIKSYIKSYYVLSKSLNGYDLNNEDVGWTEYDETLESEEYVDELTEGDEEYQERLNLLLEAIETVGRAYLENVYSYQGADGLSTFF